MTNRTQPTTHEASTGRVADQGQGFVDVQLGSRTVPVPRGGLFDRFHMQAPLDEVAKDPRVPGVEFFRELDKTKVNSPIGETWTPNFYYAMSNLRLTMLAPSKALRAKLPNGLDPLEIAPGIGLASLMFFRYDVADIDFYTEAAVGIAVRPGRHGRLPVADLASSLANDTTHAYVLALPVNTEIAQVRGHDGYGFPKWVTELDVDINQTRSSGTIHNAAGGTDISLTVDTPAQTQHRGTEKVSSLYSYTQVNGVWHSVFNQTNLVASGSAMLPKIDLQLGSGRASEDRKSVV